MSEAQSEHLVLDGELTAPHANAQRERLLNWVTANPAGQAFTLDLSSIAEMDTSGAQLLLAISRALSARGASLAIENPSHAVTGVLSTYRMLDVLGMQRSQEKAA